MGHKLLQYYRYVEENLGMTGRLKLAQETKIPSTRAALEPDSKENIEAFRKIIQQISGKPAPHF